jgi:hypothetical protein
MENYRKEIKERAEKEITTKEGERAYRNISFALEQRAETERKRFVLNVLEAFDAIVLKVNNENFEQFKALFEEFYKGYAKRNHDRLNALSNAFSTIITGGAGIDVNKHKKMSDRVRKKSEDQASFYEWKIEKILKALAPTPVETLEDLKAKLKDLKKYHELSKKLNALQRKKVNDKLEKAKEIIEEEYQGEEAIQFLKDFKWNLDNNSRFFTTNSNDKIKRLSSKIEKLEANQEKEDKTIVKNGYTIIQSFKDNRIRIVFDDMPSQEDKDYLKSHGFRWSGKNKTWQVFNTERGLQRVNAFGRYKGE